jgi:hypothetical protein
VLKHQRMKRHLEWYLEQTRQFPMLDVEKEQRLARRWRDTKDAAAAQQLLGSHLRLVIRIARGFGGYGIPLAERVAQGNLGLMRALTRFEPERGFRFATYAMYRSLTAPMYADGEAEWQGARSACNARGVMPSMSGAARVIGGYRETAAQGDAGPSSPCGEPAG